MGEINFSASAICGGKSQSAESHKSTVRALSIGVWGGDGGMDGGGCVCVGGGGVCSQMMR